MDFERQSRLVNLLVRTDRKPGNVTATLEHIAQTAQTFFTADVCVLFPMNSITGRFIGAPAVAGDLISDQVFAEQPGTDGVTVHILRRNMLVVSRVETVPEYQSRFTRSERIRSFVGLALSMRQSNKPLGVLYINFRKPRTFSIDEQNLFQMFADLSSSLLQETWLLWRCQRVAAIGQEITRAVETMNVDAFFQKLQTCMRDILDISHNLLLLVYHRQTNTFDTYLQTEGTFLLQENLLPYGACQYTMQTRQSVFIEHFSKQEPDLPFKLGHISGTDPQESLIFVPLLLNEELLGVLSIQHPEPYAYTQEDCALLELLANHTALALRNAQVYRTLSLLNETSALLTQQIGAQQALQAMVEKIRAATSADLVVLYHFEARSQHFVLPPRISGDLLDPASLASMSPNQPDGIARQILRRTRPIFAQQSIALAMQTDPNDSTRIHQGNFGRREQLHSTAALPLRVEEEAVGALFINFRQQQRFDATQRVFIESLGHSAAIAIRNAQLFGNLSQRRVSEQLILQHIDHQLNRTLLDLNEFLHTMLRLVHEQILGEEAVIFLYQPQSQELRAAAASGTHAEVKNHLVVSLQQARGITRWVFEHKRSARVENVHEDPQWRDLYISVVDEVVSELDVPLLDEDEVVGVLNFESARAGAFTREDEEFLNTLAGQIVLALKNAQTYEREKRLREEAEQSAQEARALSEVSKEIIGKLDPTRVFDLILEKALKLTGANVGSLHLYHRGRDELRREAERGMDHRGRSLRLHEGIVGEAAARKMLLNIPDLSQPPWNKIYVEVVHGVRSELAVPMLEGPDSAVRGVLNVESALPGKFRASDERLLQGLADLAMVAVQHAERYELARREAARFEQLYQAGKALGEIADLSQLDEAYKTIMHIVANHTQCQAVIRRYDDETDELVLINTAEPYYMKLRPRRKADEGIHGQAAREKRMIVIHDIHNPPPDVVPFVPSDPDMRSQIIAPILFNDRFYGTLRLGHQHIAYFQTNDQLLFAGLAYQLAIAIYRLETLRERQEYQERATDAEIMSQVGQTTFELVHRLENDLGLVKTHADAIVEAIKKPVPKKDPQVFEKLEHITRSVSKVLHLSKRLKEDWSKWGQIASNPNEWAIIHPEVLLEEMSIMPLPPTILVEQEIEPDVCKIRVRYNLVADILRNLMINAVEAMDEEGQLTLRARNAGRFVALEVSDTGPGIPAEDQDKIFHLFFTTKKSTGFGLWSARRNALGHQGDLTVRCDPDQGGATFTLLLPKVEGN